jgi:hypothetical protein
MIVINFQGMINLQFHMPWKVGDERHRGLILVNVYAIDCSHNLKGSLVYEYHRVLNIDAIVNLL